MKRLGRPKEVKTGLVILTAEVLIVITFQFMHVLGCFTANEIGLPDGYKRSEMEGKNIFVVEAGECAPVWIADVLSSRYIALLYLIKVAFVDTGLATVTEIAVLSGTTPLLTRTVIDTSIVTGFIVILAR